MLSSAHISPNIHVFYISNKKKRKNLCQQKKTNTNSHNSNHIPYPLPIFFRLQLMASPTPLISKNKWGVICPHCCLFQVKTIIHIILIFCRMRLPVCGASSTFQQSSEPIQNNTTECPVWITFWICCWSLPSSSANLENPQISARQLWWAPWGTRIRLKWSARRRGREV